MKRYTCTLERVIEAEDEEEAIDFFWQSLGQIKLIDIDVEEFDGGPI